MREVCLTLRDYDNKSCSLQCLLSYSASHYIIITFITHGILFKSSMFPDERTGGVLEE